MGCILRRAGCLAHALLCLGAPYMHCLQVLAALSSKQLACALAGLNWGASFPEPGPAFELLHVSGRYFCGDRGRCSLIRVLVEGTY